MDKTDYYDKMDALVNEKQTYQVLKRDPTPALQRKLNSKLLDLKKTDAIDTQRYNRLRCRVPQPPKLYGLPKLHKPNIPMRPIVSFCGSPTYQLSKYLTTVLKPLTDESRHKLQSTENFIDAIKTVQVPDNYKLVSFDVKSPGGGGVADIKWNSPIYAQIITNILADDCGFCHPGRFIRIFLLWKLWNLPANKAKRGDFDCESSLSLFHNEDTKSNAKA